MNKPAIQTGYRPNPLRPKSFIIFLIDKGEPTIDILHVGNEKQARTLSNGFNIVFEEETAQRSGIPTSEEKETTQ